MILKQASAAGRTLASGKAAAFISGDNKGIASFLRLTSGIRSRGDYSGCSHFANTISRVPACRLGRNRWHQVLGR
jgi:hypothetical protein